MAKSPSHGGEMEGFYLIFWLRNYPHATGTRPTMEDAVTMTQALVLDKVLTTLCADALIGADQVDKPQTGPTSPLGAALQGWLDAVLRA